MKTEEEGRMMRRPDKTPSRKLGRRPIMVPTSAVPPRSSKLSHEHYPTLSKPGTAELADERRVGGLKKDLKLHGGNKLCRV